jgi:peptide/nickel transport system substrate-binding protein
MADPRLSTLLAQVARGTISRRDFAKVAAGAGLTAATLGIAADASAAPATRGARLATRNATEPTELVVLDDLAGSSWLYLDPGKIYEIPPQSAQTMIYDTLYYLPNGLEPSNVEPLAAADFPTFSEDGLTATIPLREGATFTNSGRPVTAADWVFSFDRLKNAKGNPSFLITDFFTGYRAVDDLTLELTLISQNAALSFLLTSPPYAAIDTEEATANGASAAEDADETDTLTDWINTGNSVGSGPYKLTKWDPSEVILEANPNYWGGAPAFDRIIFRDVVDLSTQLQLLETGDADIAFTVDPDSYQRVVDNPELQVIEGPTMEIGYLAMHNTEELGGPLANVQVRQAIAHAIDFDGIIEGLAGGGAVRPATIVPLGMLGADAVEPMKYTTDLARAQELFDASGVGSAEITLSFSAGGSFSGGISTDILAAKLQADLEQINGLTVALNPMDPTQRLADFRAAKLQMTFSTWAPDYPDVHAYADPFGREGAAAAKRIVQVIPGMDDMLDAGIAELDPAKREEIYVEIQKMLIENAGFITILQPQSRMPARNNVQGITPHGVVVMQLREASKA